MISRIIRGNQQRGCHHISYRCGYPFTLIAHYNETRCWKRGFIYIVSIQQSSVNRNLGIIVQKTAKVTIYDLNPPQWTHCWLDCFGIKNVHGIFRRINPVYTEPMGGTYNSSQITGILNSVKKQIQFVGSRLRNIVIVTIRNPVYGKNIGWRGKRWNLTHLTLRHHERNIPASPLFRNGLLIGWDYCLHFKTADGIFYTFTPFRDK